MLLDKYLAIIAPHYCLVCEQEGDLLCKTCLPKAVTKKRSSCFLCNKLTANWRTCTTCRRKTKAVGVIVASHYEGPVKELVLKLKYQNTVAAADTIAQLLQNKFDPAKFDLITAIPPSSKRMRQRGYNQAQLIAKAVGKRTQLPYVATMSRLGNTRQVGTSRRQRLAQMHGSMYVTKARLVAGSRVLVVDDVVTTGATISEAARALKSAGAKSVWGLALAKH